MSIQILGKTVFLAVARKMFEATCAVRVDENYYPCCKGLSNCEIRSLVISWYNLNYDSYKSKYEQTQDIQPQTELVIVATPPPPKAVQFLKWLQCIRYNIDAKQVIESNRTSANDVLFLDRLIQEACTAIVNQLPDYKAAKWSTYK